jgi:hypothetical protein
VPRIRDLGTSLPRLRVLWLARCGVQVARHAIPHTCAMQGEAEGVGRVFPLLCSHRSLTKLLPFPLPLCRPCSSAWACPPVSCRLNAHFCDTSNPFGALKPMRPSPSRFAALHLSIAISRSPSLPFPSSPFLSLPLPSSPSLSLHLSPSLFLLFSPDLLSQFHSPSPPAPHLPGFGRHRGVRRGDGALPPVQRGAEAPNLRPRGLYGIVQYLLRNMHAGVDTAYWDGCTASCRGSQTPPSYLSDGNSQYVS